MPWPAARAAGKKLARPVERAWFERAAVLGKAAKAHASVADFRRDILAHRESLREIVRANPNPRSDILQLQRSMILMNALLHAAAECHSGGRVVCPADLIHRIDEQLKAGFGQLDAVEGGAARRKKY